MIPDILCSEKYLTEQQVHCSSAGMRSGQWSPGVDGQSLLVRGGWVFHNAKTLPSTTARIARDWKTTGAQLNSTIQKLLDKIEIQTVD